MNYADRDSEVVGSASTPTTRFFHPGASAVTGELSVLACWRGATDSRFHGGGVGCARSRTGDVCAALHPGASAPGELWLSVGAGAEARFHGGGVGCVALSASATNEDAGAATLQGGGVPA
jgi:hypothetical protein